MGRLGLGLQPFALRLLSIQKPLECVGEEEGPALVVLRRVPIQADDAELRSRPIARTDGSRHILSIWEQGL
jgi:hypothetical protein